LKSFKKKNLNLGYDDIEASTTDAGRFYSAPDGNKYPSMTTVLGGTSDKSGLDAWRKRVGEKEANRIGNYAARRGTAVHGTVEDYLSNKDPFSRYSMPHHKNSFYSLKPYLDQIDYVLGLEVPLYSSERRIAGRTDVIAEISSSVYIIDIKTSKKIKKREWIFDYFIQETGYAKMLEERSGIKIEKIITLMDVDYAKPLVFVEKVSDWTGDLDARIASYYEIQKT